jgi:hypothetical protein
MMLRDETQYAVSFDCQLVVPHRSFQNLTSIIVNGNWSSWEPVLLSLLLDYHMNSWTPRTHLHGDKSSVRYDITLQCLVLYSYTPFFRTCLTRFRDLLLLIATSSLAHAFLFRRIQEATMDIAHYQDGAIIVGERRRGFPHSAYVRELNGGERLSSHSQAIAPPPHLQSPSGYRQSPKLLYTRRLCRLLIARPSSWNSFSFFYLWFT